MATGTTTEAIAQAALMLVKSRLNRVATDTTLDEYLNQRILAAIGEIEGTGISLTNDPDDLMLVVDYTVWAYQSRDNSGGMPDWLRLRRRERWLRQHVMEESAE